jgi:hypothetical protein
MASPVDGWVSRGTVAAQGALVEICRSKREADTVNGGALRERRVPLIALEDVHPAVERDITGTDGLGGGWSRHAGENKADCESNRQLLEYGPIPHVFLLLLIQLLCRFK